MEGGNSGGTPIADVRRKAGSSLNKVGTEIGLLLLKMISSEFETPRMIANRIRRLRKHEQAAAVERHDPSSVFYRGVVEDRAILTELCWKLLESYRSWDYELRDEIWELCANDPGVYSLFRETLGQRSPTWNANYILGHTDIHEFWSTFIGQANYEGSRYSFKQVLELTPPESLYSYEITIEYLAIALLLDFKTGSKKMRDLWEAWTGLMEFWAKRSSYGGFRWDRVDFCVETILDTRKMANNFLPPSCLSLLAFEIAKYPDQFPVTLAKFYAIPDVKINRRGKHISGAVFSYAPLRNWSVVDASSYAVSFTSRLEEYNRWRIGRALPPNKTVLSDKLWMALYHVADFVLSTYLHQNGLNFTDGHEQWRYPIDLAKASLKTLAKNNSRNYTEEGVRAAFFLAQSFDVDRYCKKAVLLEFSDDTASINILNSHSRFANRLEIPNGLYDLSFMPQFDNVPYLRRFKINGEYFITSDDFPVTSALEENSCPRGTTAEFSVDTMLLDGHTLVCLRFSRWVSFDSTGHYPILAGRSNSGSPLYVGAVRVDERWYFSTVEEGADQMIYFDELVKKQSSEKFFILALRHDPSDVQPPYPRARKGAMDPTGPVYWMKFWPEKDPDYYEDPRLRDDHILESFLSDLRNRNETERYLLGGFD